MVFESISQVNNCGPACSQKVKKCQFLDSMCCREVVGFLSSHPWAFTVVFSAKVKFSSAKQK